MGGVGKSKTCPCRPQASRRADLGGFLVFHRGAFLVVAAKAARAVEDGVGSVMVLADLDPRLDEVRPHSARRNLKFQAVERHAIVVADLPLLLNA